MPVRFRHLFPLVCFIVATISAAQSRSWNGWLFAPPAGWQVQETPQGMIVAPGPTGGVNHVLLLPPQSANGTLPQWFPQAVREQSGVLRSFRPSQVKQSATPQGIPYLFVTAQGVTQQGQQVVLSYLGILNKANQGLLLVAQFDTLGALRNMRSYGEFIKTIEPGTATAAPLAPPSSQTEHTPPVRLPQQNAPAAADITLAPASTAPPAPPTGHDVYDWFGAFRNSVMPGPNFTISQVMIWTFYRFFPNGYVYEGLPAGTDPAQINCPALVKGGKCKQYKISGNTLQIEGEKSHTFAMDSSGITIDGEKNSRVRRADAPMSGMWKTSTGGGVGSTIALSQHTLTLRADGTFSINGSTGVLAPNATAYGSSANSGRYKFNGYTIEMDYSNGRVVRQSFLLPYSDNKVFLIGDAMYFVPN